MLYNMILLGLPFLINENKGILLTFNLNIMNFKNYFFVASLLVVASFYSCDENKMEEPEKETISVSVDGDNVTLFNNQMYECSEDEFVITGETTESFESEKYGKGNITLNLDLEGNLHYAIIDKKLYDNLSKMYSNELIVLGLTPLQYVHEEIGSKTPGDKTKMTSDEFIDGLKKCADKPTKAGVFTCATAHTLKMYKDCIDSEGADEATHCW
ncbi:hypothetical protein [Labilibaculum antarcticum]|uniref:Uncharacterized protein n=1 Tax=Labilibaculum antarcticum TaxID=1717717 RepID=A0A1Y1CLH2_9BACT|nr:hypothetical protein [Labilibaculum antarcticum]BAX81144.1 hypothetical protein ALGA_2839 [Labilibaculum antarcticum]